MTALQPAPTTLRVRHPGNRCRDCGDLAVRAVCTQCGSLLCTKHDHLANPVPSTLPKPRWPRRHPADHPAGRMFDADVRKSKRLLVESRRRRFLAEWSGDGEDGTDTGPVEAGGDKAEGDATPTPAAAAEPDSDIPAGAAKETDEDEPQSTKKQRRRHYCAQCLPPAGATDLELTSALATTAIGASTLLSGLPGSLWLGGTVLAVGTGRTAARLFLGSKRRLQRRRRDRPPRLNPRILKLTLTEKLVGRVEVTADGDYTSSVEPVSGLIHAELAWAREHWSRVNRYLKRQGLPSETAVACSAGTLVVGGPSSLEIEPVEGVEITDSVAVLRPTTSTQEVLRPPLGRGDPRWRIDLPYRIVPDPDRSMPVWIVPTIAPRSTRHSLELQLHWDTSGPEPEDTGIPLSEFARIELRVPGSWGDLAEWACGDGLDGDPDVTVARPGDHSEGRRTIVFKRVKLSKERRTARGGQRLVLRFTGTIGTQDEISGEILAEFAGTLSEATGIAFHAVGGARRTDYLVRKPKTQVEFEFTHDLTTVRYEETRTVPDRADAADGQVTFDGVVPDHHLVAHLTNNLSDDGYYVKRVVENPPRPGASAQTLDRLWDIAGRVYSGMHPINFHIIVTGEERHGKNGSAPGSSSVRVTVDGTYTTDDMRAAVDQAWNNLWSRIRKSVGDAAYGPDGTPRRVNEVIGHEVVELGRHRELAVRLCADLRDARARDQVDPDIADRLIGVIEDGFLTPEGS